MDNIEYYVTRVYTWTGFLFILAMIVYGVYSATQIL